jgi:poly-gamma-glutamate synthesis protein (capsule biosynthesis protein)
LDKIVYYTMMTESRRFKFSHGKFLRRSLTAFGLILVFVIGTSPILAAAPLQSAGPTLTPASINGLATLALMGDVNLGRGVHPNKKTFTYLEPLLQSADLAMANLESPLTIREVVTKSPFALCTSPDPLHYMSEAGFDLLSFANNHDHDCGLSGFKDTLAALKLNNLGAIPAGLVPVFRDVNGVKLAFLSINATWAFDRAALLKAISNARSENAVVVVSIHWGNEYFSQPSNFQKTLAKQMAEAGAALIWGTHPHVLQPVEWIDVPCDSRTPAKICRQTLVLYSLGNALFDQYALPDTRQSVLALVQVSKDGVQEFHAIPFAIDERYSRLIATDDATSKKILERLRSK